MSYLQAAMVILLTSFICEIDSVDKGELLHIVYAYVCNTYYSALHITTFLSS